MTRARLLKLGLLVLAVLGIGAVAWAYWTTQGTGSAAASVGTLNAPTDVSVPSSASGSVHVTWTGSTLGDGATPASGYYVTRIKNSDSSTSNACGTSPSSLTSSAATSCDDDGRSGRHLPLHGDGGLSLVDGHQRSERRRRHGRDLGPLRGHGAGERDRGHGVRRDGHRQDRLE